ncbi:hypothetical protein M432DRAFT_665527 [Thermoascus aurantiacus ATCC 26904]
MSTIRYIPSSLAAEVGSVQSQDQETTMTNHWALHCAISQDHQSLELDPSPSGPNLSIVPIVTRRTAFTYSPDNDVVKTVRLDITPNLDLTFGRFVALLVEKGYDRYQFTSTGQGCRFWISNLISLLRDEGYIQDSRQAQEAVDALGTVWGAGGQPVPASQQSPISPGRFF